MRRIYYLERIDDPVHVGWPFSFVAGAEDVEDFVAAMESMQVALTRGPGFVFQPLQPGERDLLERPPNHRFPFVLIAIGLVPQVRKRCFTIHEPVHRAEIENSSIRQAYCVEMNVAIAAIVPWSSLCGQRNGEAIVRIDVGSPLLLTLLFRNRMFFGQARTDKEQGKSRNYDVFHLQTSYQRAAIPENGQAILATTADSLPIDSVSASRPAKRFPSTSSSEAKRFVMRIMQ